jgi:hypothetical protein
MVPDDDLIVEIFKIQREEILAWYKESFLLRASGWTPITLNSNVDLQDVTAWLDQFIDGDYRCRNRQFLFQKNSMAILFSLRWS